MLHTKFIQFLKGEVLGEDWLPGSPLAKPDSYSTLRPQTVYIPNASLPLLQKVNFHKLPFKRGETRKMTIE